MQRIINTLITLTILAVGILVIPNNFAGAENIFISANLKDNKQQNTFSKTIEQSAIIDPNVPVFWKEISLPSSVPVHVYDLAINPTDSANIFIGTDNSSIPVIFSNDLGESWYTQTIGLPSSVNGDRVAVDPVSPNIIYAGLRIYEGIYRSDDGGQTWTEKNTGISPIPIGFSSLIVHPITPTLVMAGSAVGTPYIYRSEDRGETWTTTPLTGPNNRPVVQIFVDNGDPSKIFAVVEGEGVFISEDAGQTWDNSGIVADAFVIDPINSNIVYRLRCQLYKSENGGVNWDQLQTPEPCYDFIYIDQFDHNALYLTSPYRNVTRSLDGGESWVKLDQTVDGDGAPTSWTFEIDPLDNTRLYVQGGGFFVSLYLDHSSYLPMLYR